MTVLKISANPNHAGKPKKTKKTHFKNVKWNHLFRKVDIFLTKFIILWAKIAVGAILYIALFHFVPELREYIPSLETFCIWILKVTEKLFSVITDFFRY
mgnify:CR=1 FL=1